MSQCKDCRFFNPTYFQVGKCERQNSSNSKMFTDENKPIFVFVSFGCACFEENPPDTKGTL